MHAAVIRICQDLAEDARAICKDKRVLKVKITEACRLLSQLVEEDVEEVEAAEADMCEVKTQDAVCAADIGATEAAETQDTVCAEEIGATEAAETRDTICLAEVGAAEAAELKDKSAVGKATAKKSRKRGKRPIEKTEARIAAMQSQTADAPGQDGRARHFQVQPIVGGPSSCGNNVSALHTTKHNDDTRHCSLVTDEETGQKSYVASDSIEEGCVIMQAVPDVSSPLQIDANLSASSCEQLVLSKEELSLVEGGLQHIAQSMGEEVGSLLLALRCFRLKAEAPEKFDKLMELQSNMALQPSDTVSQWQFMAQKLEVLLKSSNHCGSAGISWAHTFDVQECVHLFGVAATNAFGTTLDSEASPVAIAICVEGSRFQHDCCPNVHVDHSAAQLTFKALRPISAGESLTISYCDAYEPVYRRMLKLATTKLFLCTCDLCKSRTELEAYQGSLRCTACSSTSEPEWLVLVEPIATSSTVLEQPACHRAMMSQLENQICSSRWSCSRASCKQEFTGQHMLRWDEELRNCLNKAEALIDMDRLQDARSTLMALVLQCKETCHPNHYIAYQARTWLATKVISAGQGCESRELLLKFELTLAGIAAGLSILHTRYDPTLGALYFELGRACQSLSELAPDVADVLKCLGNLAAEHLRVLPFDTLRVMHSERRCVLQTSEVSPAAILCHVGAQAFRFAAKQFVFCFGRASEKTQAAEMFMKVCLSQISRMLKAPR